MFYILEVRNRESDIVSHRRTSRWLWLHTLRTRRLHVGTLQYVKSYIVRDKG